MRESTEYLVPRRDAGCKLRALGFTATGFTGTENRASIRQKSTKGVPWSETGLAEDQSPERPDTTASGGKERRTLAQRTPQGGSGMDGRHCHCLCFAPPVLCFYATLLGELCQ